MKFAALVLLIAVIGTAIVLGLKLWVGAPEAPVVTTPQTNSQSFETPPGKTPTNSGQIVRSNIALQKGKLTLIQRSNRGGVVDFDVVYEGEEQVANVQGVQFAINFSPANLAANGSYTSLNPTLSSEGLNKMISTVQANSKTGQGEIRLMAARRRDGKVSLTNGKSLGSVHLVLTKGGTYTFKFFAQETIVIYGDVLPVKLALEDATWAVAK